MTRFSAPDVYQCPKCHGYLLWAGLLSFNTYGIRTTWSDGAAPLTELLDSCAIRCCPSCSTVLWKEDLAAIGTLPRAPRPLGPLARMLAMWGGDKHGQLRAHREWDHLPPGWKNAENGRYLEFADLQSALSGVTSSSPDREMFLRRRFWWATNDHARQRSDGSPVAEQPLVGDAERTANMVRLIELLEASECGIAERAELLRQLGRFDEAMNLLRSDAPEIRSSANAAWTLRWAKARDAELKCHP